MLDKFHWFTTCQSAFCYYESLLKARLKVKQKLSNKAEILSEEGSLILCPRVFTKKTKLKLVGKSAKGTSKWCQLKIVQNTV